MSFPANFAIRDLSVLSLAFGLAWVEAHSQGQVSVAAGVFAGTLFAVSAYFIHEWGHLLGARYAESTFAAPKSVFSVFLFLFDVKNNNLSQFMSMSIGGYIGTLVGGVALVLLPSELLATKTAWALALVGGLVSVGLEMPITMRAYRSKQLPSRGPAYVGVED